MAFYRVYLIDNTFQYLSSQGKDLLDAARAADAAAKAAEAAGNKEEEAAKKAEAAAKRKEASVIEGQIGKMLEDNAENYKQASAAGKPNDTSNPFPDWVQAMLTEFGDGKVKFDRMNAEYKLRTKAEDEDEGDDEWAMFKVKLEKAANESPERLDWYNSHHIQCSTVFEDEKVEMDNLERYLGGNPEAATKKTRR